MDAFYIFYPELSFTVRTFIVAVGASVTEFFIGDFKEIADFYVHGLEKVVFLFTLITVSRKCSEYT